MNSPDLPEVVVSDIETGAVLVEQPGRRSRLFLMRGQLFESAVDAAAAALPDLHPDDVRALVREAMPEAARLESVPASTGWVPGAAFHTPRALRRRMEVLRRRTAWMWASIGVAVSGLTVGAFWWQSVEARADLAAFSEARFGAFETAMGLSCEELTPLTARCTVVSGQDRGDVILAEAEIADGHLAYRLQRGSERTYLMVFESEEAARLWAAENSDEMAPTFDVDGRPITDLTPNGRYLTFGVGAAVEGVQRSLPPSESARHPLSERIPELAVATIAAMPAPGDAMQVPVAEATAPRAVGHPASRSGGEAGSSSGAAASEPGPGPVPSPSCGPEPSATSSPSRPPAEPSPGGRSRNEPDVPARDPGGREGTPSASGTGTSPDRPQGPPSESKSEGGHAAPDDGGEQEQSDGEQGWDDFDDWTDEGWGGDWVSWTWLGDLLPPSLDPRGAYPLPDDAPVEDADEAVSGLVETPVDKSLPDVPVAGEPVDVIGDEDLIESWEPSAAPGGTGK